MKIFAVSMLVGLMVVASAAYSSNDTSPKCFDLIDKYCKEKVSYNDPEKTDCLAMIPQYKHTASHLITFANRQFESSYKYMLLAAQFKSYIKDRPGFHGKLKALSDRSWEQGIGLIKYMTKRGGKMKFADTNELTDGISEMNELQTMATVLDTEKRLFEGAREIHNVASHANNHLIYDPEVAHFIEEEHLSSLAGSVRQYAGYANDLKNLYVGSKDINMDNYLYDQYLQKA